MTEIRGPNGHAPAPRGTLHRLLASASDGVFVTTEDNRIALWNRAAETLMGYTAREAFGHPCREILAGRGARGTPRCVTGCDVAPMLTVDGLDQTFEMQTRTKTGDPRWLNITAFAITDGQGGGPFIVHVLRDVTRSKHLHTLVRERVARALHAGAGGRLTPEGPLTPREVDVLRLMTTGLGTAATAERLHVSRATVRNHVQNIFGKLGVHTRLEAVAYATRHRLL
jgi:PAS domain S-box-containing protein